MDTIDYNKEPVFYCDKCLSLKIRGIEDCNYCDDCGSTEVKQTSIEEWENLYMQKFGIKYINK